MRAAEQQTANQMTIGTAWANSWALHKWVIASCQARAVQAFNLLETMSDTKSFICLPRPAMYGFQHYPALSVKVTG